MSKCYSPTEIQPSTTGDSSTEESDLVLFEKEVIGRKGHFGIVIRGKLNGQPCAVKLIQDTQNTVERLRKDCEYLESFEHPNIVRYLATRIHPSTSCLVLVLELMDCSLRQFFSSPSGKDLPFLTQKSLCRDIASALAYIHSRKLAHSDLCSNNILLDCKGETPVAKVCDFGMAGIIDSRGITMIIGYRGYMLEFIPSKLDDLKLDIFAFGAIMVQIVCCIPHFKTDIERKKHFKDIEASHPLKSIIEECLKEKRKNRPSAVELEKKLS